MLFNSSINNHNKIEILKGIQVICLKRPGNLNLRIRILKFIYHNFKNIMKISLIWIKRMHFKVLIGRNKS